MTKTRWISASFLLGFSLVLAACNNNPLIVTRSNCPAVAVMAHTGTITMFKGESRNQSDVMWTANISNLERNCEQDETLVGTTNFVISVQKGPAFEGNEVTVPYFAALLRDNHLVTAKQVYEATVRFAPNSNNAAVMETIEQTFTDIDIARRYNYEMLVGFQLTANQVAFNMLR